MFWWYKRVFSNQNKAVSFLILNHIEYFQSLYPMSTSAQTAHRTPVNVLESCVHQPRPEPGRSARTSLTFLLSRPPLRLLTALRWSDDTDNCQNVLYGVTSSHSLVFLHFFIISLLNLKEKTFWLLFLVPLGSWGLGLREKRLGLAARTDAQTGVLERSARVSLKNSQKQTSIPLEDGGKTLGAAYTEPPQRNKSGVVGARVFACSLCVFGCSAAAGVRKRLTWAAAAPTVNSWMGDRHGVFWSH